MRTEAIQSHNQRKTVLGPVGAGAAIGAVGGYVLKYTYPVTADEKMTDEYIKVSKKIQDEKTEYNFRTEKYIKSLNAKPEKSLAEDEFIKMYDGLQEGDHVGVARLRKAIKNLQQKNPSEVPEFKRICKETSEVADKTAKQCVGAYNLMTKHIRPTAFFLITGAVVGAIIALINDILKTDVKK